MDYEGVITLGDIPKIFERRTNLWLIVQGVTAQLAYGSLIWVPLLYQSKVLEQGYSSVTATRVGGMYAAMFQVAAVSSIAAGWLGDRWQQRDLRGRAFLSMFGILGAIPFFIAFFFVPLRGLNVDPASSGLALLADALSNLASAPLVGLAFGLAVVAAVLTSADSPNWFALISDVNFPEHRGTVFGLGNLANGIGRFTGNWLTGVAAATLITSFAAPLNYALALTMFQVGFLPTGYAYWKATKTAPGDIESMRATLIERARASRGS
ncbi:MAG: MFS transporter [Acidimicrobiia bacterium]|nr:MFS transporter [Acidimicrobiia bacterium]